MNAFTIKDLENLSGIKAHTIRIWEQRYSFLKPSRTGTNIRYYSNDELKMILNIALLNKYGFKISHIDKMSPAEMANKIQLLPASEAVQERLLNDLVNYMIDLDIDSFEEVLTTYIHEKGIEKTIFQLIFPLLEKVGVLWQTNHIYPAQEHLVTNVIRQKLVAGIENLRNQPTGEQLVILFLPENEFHELGLLYIHYLLKKQGIKCLYLGASVPLKDLSVIIDIKKPSFLQMHLSSVAHNFNLEKYLNQLHTRFPAVTFIISGPVTHAYKKTIPSNVVFKKSLAEVMAHIQSI